MLKYEGQKGNYITIYNKMIDEGIYANSIAEGYDNKEGKSIESYKQLTYHIKNVFIIFDWDKQIVIKKEKESEIVKGVYDYLLEHENVKKEQLNNYSINGCHIGVDTGNNYYNVTIYSRDGDFAYSLQN